MSVTTSLAIRLGRPADAATIADFNVRLAQESEGLALEPATVRAGVEALLHDPAKGVYVAAEARGSGVFRALWERALETARGAGARAVRLYVDEHNAGAQEVYRRIGMRDSGYRVFELEPV